MYLRGRWTSALRRSEAGQSLALFSVSTVALCGILGMAVDVGQLVGARGAMQNAADAAVLAGAQELPESVAAQAVASDYVLMNSASGTEGQYVVSSQYYPDDTLEVTVSTEVEFTFLRVIGLSGSTVSATATARRGVLNGYYHSMPWGIVANENAGGGLPSNSCYEGQDADGSFLFEDNTECTLKYGAGTNQGGDFGALAVDGVGADAYRSAIVNGIDKVINIGDQLISETGNMQGPTAQGMDDRFSAAAPATCAGNERSQVLYTNSDESVSIKPGCEDSPRLVTVPIVDQIDNPNPSTVLGFALMYIYPLVQGQQTVLKGEFLSMVTRLDDGAYMGTSATGASAVLLEQ